MTTTPGLNPSVTRDCPRLFRARCRGCVSALKRPWRVRPRHATKGSLMAFARGGESSLGPMATYTPGTSTVASGMVQVSTPPEEVQKKKTLVARQGRAQRGAKGGCTETARGMKESGDEVSALEAGARPGRMATSTMASLTETSSMGLSLLILGRLRSVSEEAASTTEPSSTDTRRARLPRAEPSPIVGGLGADGEYTIPNAHPQLHCDNAEGRPKQRMIVLQLLVR
eukprot:scaffold1172_cov247-Pinguiococcus_pyrenoidosus.AAC.18